MTVDWSISFSSIIQMAMIVFGGLSVVIMLRSDVSALKEGNKQLRLDFAAMQTEIKEIGKILINLADIRGDIRELTSRVKSAEDDIRELRHGVGFIQNRSQGGIDGEYP